MPLAGTVLVQPYASQTNGMNARFNPQAEDLQCLQVGPIGPHLQSFAALVARLLQCERLA
jgi:hypothetical protein